VEALLDASEDDVATGGPSVYRRIFPIALAVTASGADEVPEAEIEAAARAVLEERG
jgi:proteasome beta subunit